MMVAVMAIAVLSRKVSWFPASLEKHPVVAKVAATASLLSPLL